MRLRPMLWVCAALVLAGTRPAAAADAAVDTAAAKPPKPHPISYTYDVLDNCLIRPATRFFDVALLARRITHNPREAANVDADDNVRLPSTWWQPRIGFRPVSVADMLAGPGSGRGPAPGRWTITNAKSQGVTPGFQIKDSEGAKFIIKFDIVGSPECATGADVIGSYLFWAAGYNVPENTIEHFRVDDLDISPKATFSDAHGHKRPMTRAYLDQLLSRTVRMPDGRYRCMASRYLSGKPLGPFQYFGTRDDDPEDMVPHELRRELRGLWTVAAWVNHADSRGPNSLDMWVDDGGRSFVRHYLIDFGSILGSTATTIKRDQSTGFEYYLDYGAMVKNTATLGLRRAPWESLVDPQIPAVGVIDSKKFDPDDWRPDMPNPAFDERTKRDIRWGARIVAGFTNEHIRAAVAKAQFSDPRAADYLTQVLIERRDKLVAHWLGTSAAASPQLSTTP